METVAYHTGDSAGELLPKVSERRDGPVAIEGAIGATYTLICDKCLRAYHSKEAFPKPQICPQCSKRTPQKHRQYWAVFWAVRERGGMIRTKGGLLKLKDEIEEWEIGRAHV